MPYCVSGLSNTAEDIALANMFRERKRVFIDLLKWDVPALAESFEVDQFDNALATYLVLAGPDGAHHGSMRLLPSCAPHILGSIFPELCDDAPPSSPDVMEISRFCLSRDLRAAERLVVRNKLVTMAACFALDHGIRAYSCVADIGWISQIPSFGWRCRSLGRPRRLDCGMTGALEIEISAETPALMAAAGVWAPCPPPSSTTGPRVIEREVGHVVH